jgi:hypothetical protein
MNVFVNISTGLLLGVSCLAGPAQAAIQPTNLQNINPGNTFKIAEADQSKLITENRKLLVDNRALARKIATKLGLTSTGEIPTTGSPLEQNQVLIMQNQETFKAIAMKVGATVPTLEDISATDIAEKNHKLLLQNRSIVVGILTKLGITPAAPPTLTGTFVEKNNVLLKGNAAALGKIAAKLGVS